jgi:hypothetical protein
MLRGVAPAKSSCKHHSYTAGDRRPCVQRISAQGSTAWLLLPAWLHTWCMSANGAESTGGHRQCMTTAAAAASDPSCNMLVLPNEPPAAAAAVVSKALVQGQRPGTKALPPQPNHIQHAEETALLASCLLRMRALACCS